MQISPKEHKYLLLILGILLLLPWLPMIMMPFTDTTEARYAEIARIMTATNDWITPYLDYGIPFWGKPPFSFWLQALSFKLFGLNEFAPRLPSWLAIVAIIGLIYHLLRSIFNQQSALFASLIFMSCLLVLVLSGAVLTDPFLTLAVTLSLVSFIMVRHKKAGGWQYWFFVGLALGLLAKGPIALVLTAGPLGIWLLLSKYRWQDLALFPWFSGILLTASLTLPWYIAAEIKTPGFIQYFILGEHFYRFVDPGWAGDLYGTAHKQIKGTIWILWLAASLPWGLVALAVLLRQSFSQASRTAMRQQLANEDISLLFLWAIFPMCFFSLAGNVLWTYSLPALPALAILLALYISHAEKAARWLPLMALGSLMAPLTLLAVTFYVSWHPEKLPTEKHLIEHYQSVATAENSLFFIGDRSFSARYYSRGNALLLTTDELKNMLKTTNKRTLYLALPKKQAENILQQTSLAAVLLFESNQFKLYKTHPVVSSQVE